MPIVSVRDEINASAKKLGVKSKAANAASTFRRVSRGAVRGKAEPATIARSDMPHSLIAGDQTMGHFEILTLF